MMNPDREELVKLRLFTPGELAVRLDEWANCLPKAQADLRSDMRCAAIHLRSLASSDGGVKVRDLEWRLRSSAFCDEWKADTVVGRYDVGRVGDNFLAVRRAVSDGLSNDDVLIRGADENAAKAAAQADYEARIKSALVEVPAVNTAPPADAGMREALKFAHSTMESLRVALRDDPAVHGRVWIPHGIALNSAIRKADNALADAALTAPGATTKSDGGFLSPLPSGEGELAVTQVWPPSDPSSTRSDVTVDELAAFLDPGAFSGSATDRHRHCSPWLVETVQDRARDKARALLDQFEIRRK